MATHYAIMHDTEEVIATGETYLQTSDAALKTGVWDMKAGSVAPYFITTIPPLEK